MAVLVAEKGPARVAVVRDPGLTQSCKIRSCRLCGFRRVCVSIAAVKTVLIVDDDPGTRALIRRSLEPEHLELLLADNGREALEILECQMVDLVLTDLYMPEVDGFELLATMLKQYASVPVIVMSSSELPELGEELTRWGALRFLEKPFDYLTLAITVREILARTSQGRLTGVSLLGFLQLLSFEKKSVTLTVRSDHREGLLHVTAGEVVNASYDLLRGEAAVGEIFSWDDCDIDVSVPRQVERLIFRSLEGLLLEAAKELDETRAVESGELESRQATPPEAGGDSSAFDNLRRELPLRLEQMPAPAGMIGVALADVRQDAVLSSRCFGYWPDFDQRVAASAPMLRRRLELDDAAQVGELAVRLEALVELWRPLASGRRLALYALVKRSRGALAAARTALEELEAGL